MPGLLKINSTIGEKIRGAEVGHTFEMKILFGHIITLLA